RIRHHHVRWRRSGRPWKHYRAVLGRHDNRPCAAAIHAGLANAASEYRDFRRVPLDHFLAAARFLWPRGGEDVIDAGPPLSRSILHFCWCLRAGHIARHELLLSADADDGARLGLLRPLVECAQRVYWPRIVWPRSLLRYWRLYDGTGPASSRSLALAADPRGVCAGCVGRFVDRAANIPSPGRLFRLSDARLSLGAPLRVRVAGLPGGDPADEARQRVCVYAVCGPAHLHDHRASDAHLVCV